MSRSSKAAGSVALHADYQRRVAFLLGAVSNLIAARGSRHYRQTFNLGLGEARLLYVLGHETNLTAGRASQIMGIDKGATSRALAVLQRRELVKVTVDAADARQKVLHLTASGKQLCDRLMTVALQREKHLMSVFSAREVALLSDLLQRLRTHLPTIPVTAASPVVREARRTIAVERRGTRRGPRRSDA